MEAPAWPVWLAQMVGTVRNPRGSACLALAAATPAQQGPGQPQYTIQTRVPITIVDVTVTDAKGKPVHGLQQTDFTVLEDGMEMRPNSFEEHSAEQATTITPALVKQELPPNTFTNVTPTPPKASPLNILLLDNLNTPLQAQQQVTQRMIDFVNKMTPGTQVAVFRLTTRLVILQGFTSDPELLKVTLTSKKNYAQPSPIEDPGQDVAEPPAPEPPDVATEKEGTTPLCKGSTPSRPCAKLPDTSQACLAQEPHMVLRLVSPSIPASHRSESSSISRYDIPRQCVRSYR